IAAVLQITTASSLVFRSAIASATSVLSARSEDIGAVGTATDEHAALDGRQEHAAHDEAQVAGIDVRKLGREAPALVRHSPGEEIHLARTAAASAVPAGRGS